MIIEEYLLFVSSIEMCLYQSLNEIRGVNSQSGLQNTKSMP